MMRVGGGRRSKAREAGGGSRLTFSGSLTVEMGSAGPHFTLVVLKPPTGVIYTFAKTVDASSKFTLANGDEVTVTDSATGGPYSGTFTATPSDSPTHRTLTITVQATVVDTTAPVLTLPTDTKTGSTTATLTVTTDTGEGTLYAVSVLAGTQPTSAQVIAGQDSTGSAAGYAHNQPVSASGLQTVSATGLVAATHYLASYFAQKDASNNVSTVSAADGFTTDSSATFLIDVLGVSAVRAYSMRKLRAAYAGSAIRVLESGGSTQQDIGFDGSGNLDTTALASFVGSNSGFITKWYDQSGNGDDLLQASVGNQPRIVNSGTIDTRNSLPSANFVVSSASSMLSASASTPVEIGAVVASAAAQTGPAWSTYLVVVSGSGSGLDNLGFFADGSVSDYDTRAGNCFTTCSVNNGSNAAVFGAVLQQVNEYGPGGTWAAVQMAYNSSFASQSWQGYVSEVVLFSTQLSSGNRTAMYSNQKSYWGTP